MPASSLWPFFGFHIVASLPENPSKQFVFQKEKGPELSNIAFYFHFGKSLSIYGQFLWLPTSVSLWRSESTSFGCCPCLIDLVFVSKKFKTYFCQDKHEQKNWQLNICRVDEMHTCFVSVSKQFVHVSKSK